MRKKIILIRIFLVLLFTTSIFARDFPIISSPNADFTNDIVYYIDKVEFPSEKNATYIIYYLEFFMKSLKTEKSSKDSLFHAKIYMKIKVIDTKTNEVVKTEELKRSLTATVISTTSSHIEYFGLELNPGSYKISIEIYDCYPDADGNFPEGTKSMPYAEEFSIESRSNNEVSISDPIIASAPISPAKKVDTDFVLNGVYVYPNVQHVISRQFPISLFFTIGNLKRISGNARVEVEYKITKDGIDYYFIREVFDTKFSDIIHPVNPRLFSSVYSLPVGKYNINVKVKDLNGQNNSSKDIKINLIK
ncbi:hypothetical protein KAU33_12450 [Candidatus Dependentiae bacterium]|nr:hypothetical protein [Candidatus Dependentiae bacterium]